VGCGGKIRLYMGKKYVCKFECLNVVKLKTRMAEWMVGMLAGYRLQDPGNRWGGFRGSEK